MPSFLSCSFTGDSCPDFWADFSIVNCQLSVGLHHLALSIHTSLSTFSSALAAASHQPVAASAGRCAPTYVSSSFLLIFLIFVLITNYYAQLIMNYELCIMKAEGLGEANCE